MNYRIEIDKNEPTYISVVGMNGFTEQRRGILPGRFVDGVWQDTDVSGEAADVRAVIADQWTPGNIAAFKARNAPPSTNPNDYPLRPDQFWSMMDIAGLRSKVLASIDAIPDPVQKIIASNKLNHVQVFERSNPLFTTLKGAVGMTDAQIDAMWMQAKDLP